MNRITPTTVILLVISFMASLAFAEPNWIGYSGAPGRQNCASSCHGTGGGTVEVLGFPETYEPDSTYFIALHRINGSTIKNFNASCRIGTGTTNAGEIVSGYRTVTYSTTGETNGIHLSQSNRDSCNFSWTAPSADLGEVRLYVAAHQGGYGGPNTDIVLVAEESTELLPPDPAANPFPANPATEVPPDVVLTWDEADRAEFYDVYFGVTSPPPFVGEQTMISYDPPGNLELGLTCYWRIDTRNAAGTTTGEEWQFTTTALAPQAANPFPEDGAADVPLNTQLSWSPSPGALWYNIYFGTTNTPPFITFQAETTFNPGTLTANTVYFWKINPGTSGGETEGFLWHFTTATPPSSSDLPLVPWSTALLAPYPNPFNAEVSIPFELATAQNISLTVYDLSGREVEQLFSGSFPAGQHLAKWNSRNVSSGVYIVKLSAGNNVFTTKILALK